MIVTAPASVSSVFLFEYLIQKFLMKEPTIYDGSAILTGVLLAFNLPSNLPIRIIAIGALAAIGIGKDVVRRPGQQYFPALLTGRIFLLISFPAQMTTDVVGQLTHLMPSLFNIQMMLITISHNRICVSPELPTNTRTGTPTPMPS